MILRDLDDLRMLGPRRVRGYSPLPLTRQKKCSVVMRRRRERITDTIREAMARLRR